MRPSNDALCVMYAVSEERERLTKFELEGRKPSQLFRAMKLKESSKVADSILKSLWLQRLPASLQAILSIAEATDFSRMSQITDRIREV